MKKTKILLLLGLFFGLVGCSATRVTYNIKDSESDILKDSEYHISLIRTFNKLKNAKKGFIYGFEGWPMKAENTVRIVPFTIEEFEFTQNTHNIDYVSISYSMDVSLSKAEKEKLMISRQFENYYGLANYNAGYFLSPYSSISDITSDNVIGLRVTKFWIV